MDEKIVEAVARAIWREREIGFPPRVRRPEPDQFDKESGAWDACMREARAAVDAHTAALAEAVWLPIETAPKDGKQIILWVCTRGSIRRGWPEICWWGRHADWGETWCRWDGTEVVGPGVATHWRPLPAAPDQRAPRLDLLACARQVGAGARGE